MTDATQPVQQDPKYLRHIVAVRPGSSAVNPLRFTLPYEKVDLSIAEVVEYGLSQNHARAAERIAEAIQAEMAQEYGVTVNDTAVGKTDAIKPYFTMRQAPDDNRTEYMGVDIIVASKQTGGLANLVR